MTPPLAHASRRVLRVLVAAAADECARRRALVRAIDGD